MNKKKRALALSGGGPLVGLHVGALKALGESSIDFDVWTCDCIGSWAGCVYNSSPAEFPVEQKQKRLEEFFTFLFVDDSIYKFFPVPTSVFVMDYPRFFQQMAQTWASSWLDVGNIFRPQWVWDMMQIVTPDMLPLTEEETYGLMGKLMSINPQVRAAFNSFWNMPRGGLSLSETKHEPLIWKKFMDMDRLNNDSDVPAIYINAYNLDKRQIELFSNDKKYKSLSVEALQAGSSVLYYVQPPVINGDRYCEGANKDTLNFKDLLVNHPDLDEIWIVRLTDYQYVDPPETPVQAASLQVMLPFSTIADDDIKLFKYHIKDEGRLREVGMTREQADKILINEIQVKQGHFDKPLTYEWNQSNYENCRQAGYVAAKETIKEYSS